MLNQTNALNNLPVSIDFSDVILFLTLLIGAITLFLNFMQKRRQEIINYYNKTQEIRDQLDNLGENKKQKAESLLKKNLNLHNLFSYSVLSNILNEKDAYRLLKNDLFYIHDKCEKREDTSLSEYPYLIKLAKRWKYHGLKPYRIKTWTLRATIFLAFMVLLYFLV